MASPRWDGAVEAHRATASVREAPGVALADDARAGDLAFEQDGLRLFVDPMSSMYLQGVTVDYVVGLQGAGFKFNNPNARNTCGCGQSFTY